MTNLERYRRRKKRARRIKVYTKILALFVICFMPFFLFRTAAAAEQKAEIYITVADAEILQGGELPEYQAEISAEGRADLVLDEEDGYTAGELLAELKSGGVYTLQSNADSGTEGEYPIILNFSEDFKNKLYKYERRLSVQVKNGTLKVKNPVGEWDGTKFKKYDGSYVAGEFVVSRGDTYYFNTDGEKVTGWQNVDGSWYYFDELGILQRNCWQQNGESKSYLNEQGAAVTGWLTLEDKRYYFDENGLMETGQVVLGFTIYQFADDGSLLSERVMDIDPDKPMVALTFDDGPGKRTGELLDCLEEYHAHATFFMQGKSVPKYADEVKRMLEIGCELGNHSYDHADLGKAEEEKIKSEIGDTNENLKQITGQGATVMRPPYGSISDTLRESVGMPMILWNVDTLDWKTRNAQSTIDNVMDSLEDGNIILMHDIHTESVDAAMELIPKLQEAGYQLVTVTELAAAKGISLEDGEKYTDFVP